MASDDKQRPPVQLRWPFWIGVVCEDLERQRVFYRDVLGMTELAQGEDWVWFTLDGKLFELLGRSHKPQYDRVRYQVGFGVEDIVAARESMLARGVEAVTEIEGGEEPGQLWAYFRDPEGNVFEITQKLEVPPGDG